MHSVQRFVNHAQNNELEIHIKIKLNQNKIIQFLFRNFAGISIGYFEYSIVCQIASKRNSVAWSCRLNGRKRVSNVSLPLNMRFHYLHFVLYSEWKVNTDTTAQSLFFSCWIIMPEHCDIPKLCVTLNNSTSILGNYWKKSQNHTNNSKSKVGGNFDRRFVDDDTFCCCFFSSFLLYLSSTLRSQLNLTLPLLS